MGDHGSHFQWTQYKGKRILFVDFSNILEEAAHLKAIEELEVEIFKLPKEHQSLILIDQSGSIASKAVTDRSKQMMAAAKKKGIPDSPTALVGNTGFSKAVALAIQFFRPDIYLADDVEAAKEWLINRATE
jgi:hypothetical protein